MSQCKNFNALRRVLVFFICAGLLAACPEPKPKSDSPRFETVVITPAGGEYELPGGITLRVPPGAVAENTEIQLRRVGSEEISAALSETSFSEEYFYPGVAGLPHGQTFLLPIEVEVAGVTVASDELPVPHQIDLETGTYTLSDAEVFVDPEKSSMTYKLQHFSLAAALRAWRRRRACGDDPCRCGIISTKVRDSDVTPCGDGQCQVTTSQVDLTYHQCQGVPTEQSVFDEISAHCEPDIALTAAASRVDTGGRTTVTANVTFACKALETQLVSFSPQPGNLAHLEPASGETDSQGVVTSTFVAGDQEGRVTVQATADVSFVVHASTAGGQTWTSEPRTKTGSGTVELEIKNTERYRLTIEVDAAGASYDGVYYDMSIDAYTSTVVYDITVPEDENAEQIWLNGDVVAVTQTGGEITVTPKGPVYEDMTAIDAWVENASFPTTGSFDVHGEINLDTRDGFVGFVGDVASWTVGVTVDYSGLFTQDAFFDHVIGEVGSGGCGNFDFRLEHGFTASGEASLCPLQAAPAFYTLTVTRLDSST